MSKKINRLKKFQAVFLYLQFRKRDEIDNIFTVFADHLLHPNHSYQVSNFLPHLVNLPTSLYPRCS